jgi:hypothetical protein
MKLNPQIKDPNVIYINQKLAVPYQSKVQNKNTAELFSAVEEGGFKIYVTKEGKVVYEDVGVGQCGVLGDKLSKRYANEAEVKNYKDFESFKRNIISEGHLKNYEMNRMYGNGDPMGMGGDLRYDINKDPAVDSYLRSEYEIYQKTGKVGISTVGAELHNIGSVIEGFKKENPTTAELIKGILTAPGKVVSLLYEYLVKRPLNAPIDYLYGKLPENVKEHDRKIATNIKDYIKDIADNMTPEQKTALRFIDTMADFTGSTLIINSAGKLLIKDSLKTSVLETSQDWVKKVFSKGDEVGDKLKDGAKGALGKSDEFHSKTKVEKVEVASVVKSDILDKHFGGKVRLADHEGLAHGGHTKELHVGLSEKDLKKRIVNEGKDFVTTYQNEKMAESVITEVIMKNEKKINKWLKGERFKDKNEIMVSGDLKMEIGYGVRKDGSTVKLTKASVVLIKTEEGIKVLTSHPIE